MHQDKQQCANKGKEIEGKLVNMDMNNVGFNIPYKKKSALNMFYEGDSLVGPKGYTQCVLVGNTGCQHNLIITCKSETHMEVTPIAKVSL